MFSRKSRYWIPTLAVPLAAVAVMHIQSAHADTVLTSTSGNVQLGVEDLGATGLSTGLDLAGVGDAITPGCYCEGWGAGYTGFSGYSANDNGSANVTGVSFTVGTDTATSVVDITGSALQVTQTYSASTANGIEGLPTCSTFLPDCSPPLWIRERIWVPLCRTWPRGSV